MVQDLQSYAQICIVTLLGGVQWWGQPMYRCKWFMIHELLMAMIIIMLFWFRSSACNLKAQRWETVLLQAPDNRRGQVAQMKEFPVKVCLYADEIGCMSWSMFKARQPCSMWF